MKYVVQVLIEKTGKVSRKLGRGLLYSGSLVCFFSGFLFSLLTKAKRYFQANVIANENRTFSTSDRTSDIRSASSKYRRQ